MLSKAGGGAKAACINLILFVAEVTAKLLLTSSFFAGRLYSKSLMAEVLKVTPGPVRRANQLSFVWPGAGSGCVPSPDLKVTA